MAVKYIMEIDEFSSLPALTLLIKETFDGDPKASLIITENNPLTISSHEDVYAKIKEAVFDTASTNSINVNELMNQKMLLGEYNVQFIEIKKEE